MIQLALLAILAALGFAGKHAYDSGKRAEGRMEMIPAIATLTKQLESDVEAFGKINGYMLEIKAGSDRLKKQVTAAQTANTGRRTVEKTRIEYIDRIVPTGATECERTSDAIKKVLR